MPRLYIPEAKRIRRLAAALATMGAPAVRRKPNDLDLPVGLFFRQFPWEKRRRKAVGRLPVIDVATVGQYFAAFDWDAVPPARSERITEVEDSPGRVSSPQLVDFFAGS